MGHANYYWLYYEHPRLCSFWEQGFITLAELWDSLQEEQLQ